MVTQKDLLANADRLHAIEAAERTDAEIRLDQVKLADPETLTGLKLGLPASALAPLPTEAIRIAMRGCRLRMSRR